MLISHRGNDNHIYKENTIEALNYSLNQEYIDGVELDIRMTNDKKIVINHNIIHNSKIICKTNYKELNIDLLDDFLREVNTNKIILIEIKEELNNYKIIYQLYKIMKQYNLNYYIMSFNYNLIKKFKKFFSKYKCGLLVTKTINKDKNIDLFDFVAYKYNCYKDINKEEFVWTINDYKNYLKYKEKNVFIITDKAYMWYNLSR